jgi:Lon protease-like protein
MITPSQAEALAQHVMQEYVKQCECDTNEDVANVLMKMVSMCGLGMCAVVGQADAVDRLESTAAYIAQTQQGKHWHSERTN